MSEERSLSLEECGEVMDSGQEAMFAPFSDPFFLNMFGELKPGTQTVVQANEARKCAQKPTSVLPRLLRNTPAGLTASLKGFKSIELEDEAEQEGSRPNSPTVVRRTLQGSALTAQRQSMIFRTRLTAPETLDGADSSPAPASTIPAGISVYSAYRSASRSNSFSLSDEAVAPQPRQPPAQPAAPAPAPPSAPMPPQRAMTPQRASTPSTQSNPHAFLPAPPTPQPPSSSYPLPPQQPAARLPRRTTTALTPFPAPAPAISVRSLVAANPDRDPWGNVRSAPFDGRATSPIAGTPSTAGANGNSNSRATTPTARAFPDRQPYPPPQPRLQHSLYHEAPDPRVSPAAASMQFLATAPASTWAHAMVAPDSPTLAGASGAGWGGGGGTSGGGLVRATTPSSPSAGSTLGSGKAGLYRTSFIPPPPPSSLPPHSGAGVHAVAHIHSAHDRPHAVQPFSHGAASHGLSPLHPRLTAPGFHSTPGGLPSTAPALGYGSGGGAGGIRGMAASSSGSGGGTSAAAAAAAALARHGAPIERPPKSTGSVMSDATAGSGGGALGSGGGSSSSSSGGSSSFSPYNSSGGISGAATALSERAGSLPPLSLPQVDSGALSSGQLRPLFISPQSASGAAEEAGAMRRTFSATFSQLPASPDGATDPATPAASQVTTGGTGELGAGSSSSGGGGTGTGAGGAAPCGAGAGAEGGGTTAATATPAADGSCGGPPATPGPYQQPRTTSIGQLLSEFAGEGPMSAAARQLAAMQRAQERSRKGLRRDAEQAQGVAGRWRPMMASRTSGIV